MRSIKRLFIHCTATPPSNDYGMADLRRDHVGTNGWSDVGYHYLIDRAGRIHKGRPDHIRGAHAYGHNHDSIGIALAGGVDEQGKPDSNYTAKQWKNLASLTRWLLERNPGIDWIGGHRDVTDKKACPCFDAQEWAKGL